MKKVLRIVLALALVLTMAVASAVPAAAVQAPIYVEVEHPIAKEAGDYTITFHNIGTLIAGVDWIDIMFPFGTDVTTVSAVALSAGPTKHTTTIPCGPATFSIIAPSTVRLWPSCNISKCMWVKITVDNVTNPLPCHHHLEVGTSTHSPVDSNEYIIYCIKIILRGGVTPEGAAMMNLISIPGYTQDESIEVVLKDLFTIAAATTGDPQPFTFSVWYWDAVELEWLIYASDTSFESLETIEPGKAYWIKPSEDITINIHCIPYPPGQGPPEKFCWYVRSWNMVGFACTESRKPSQYLHYATLPPYYIWAFTAIWGFNAGTQSYYDLGWPPDLAANLTPGQGYWISFLDSACIIPPPDCDC